MRGVDHADVDHHGPKPRRDDRIELVALVLVEALGYDRDLEDEADREPGNLAAEQRVRRYPVRVTCDKKCGEHLWRGGSVGSVE